MLFKSKYQNINFQVFMFLDYFVKWWYFSFGKSFFETSRCSMFIIMSTIIPQSFTFFGIYLIFLNSISKSDKQFSYQFSVDRTGRPNLRSKVHWATEACRSTGPVDRWKFSVDRRIFRSTDECFFSFQRLVFWPLLGAVFVFLFGFLAEFWEGINTQLLISF